MKKHRIRPAHRKVAEAVKSGSLVKTPCVICGSTVRVEGHHANGYDNGHELDVTWLCQFHHQTAHLGPRTRLTEPNIRAAIAETRTITAAARRLGVTRMAVYLRMHQYGIPTARDRGEKGNVA